MTPDALARLRPSRQHRSPATWRLTGTLASVALAVSSWFCAAVPHEFSPVVWPGIVPWRPEGGSNLAASVAVLAMSTLVYCWWALRDAPVGLAWVRRTAGWWCGPLVLSAPLYSRDLYSYAAQGLMLHTGLDPYTQGVRMLDSPWVDSVARTWLDTPAPYGPVFLVLARVVAGVAGGHLLVALALLRLGSVLAVAALAWGVPVVARRLGGDERAQVRALWLGVLTPVVGGHLVSGAHNDGLMVAGVVAAAALALERRWAAAMLLVSLATAVKAPAAVAVPFVALLWAADNGSTRWVRVVGRALLASALTAVVFAGLSLATGLGFRWLGALSAPGQASSWTAVSTAWGTIAGWVGGADLGASVTSGGRVAALVVLGLLLVVLWLDAARHAHDPLAVCRAAGFALLAVALLSPAFYPWYLLWALPLLAATLRDRRAVTAFALLAALLAFATLPGGYGLAYSTTSVGAPAMVVTSVVLAVRGVRRLRAYPWPRLLTVEPGASR
ncbi:MAG: polyprenol phosphomannose-dependent alpha 1,6 mannosyltransferase MptB [Actinomycetota bacterium]|nr:polyprenol phosphomannose-dependent alpha 1,6 mannosyltransferase MptB [Actinomycetota bacterium]